MSNIEQNNFFHTAIKSACPNVKDIKHIESCPSRKPIFLVETCKSEPIVFKFVDPIIARRDRDISERLNSKGLPVPKIRIAGYVAQWYETYKFNPNKTLEEHIRIPLDDDRILATYKQILDVQAKIAESSLDEISNNTGKYFVDIYKLTAPTSRSKLTTAVYSIVIKYLSQHHNARLLHNDLNRQNILCNPDGSLNQIIDITGISLASEEFAMISLLNYFPLPDLSDELMDYYDKITKRKLDRKFIYGALKLYKYKKRFQDTISDIRQAVKRTKVK